MTERNEQFDNMLNETQKPITVCGQEFYPADILYKCDPIAYHIYSIDYADSMAEEYPICPGCEGYIPNNETPGKYPGAISRRDSSIEICSACGVKEALEDFVLGSSL